VPVGVGTMAELLWGLNIRLKPAQRELVSEGLLVKAVDVDIKLGIRSILPPQVSFPGAIRYICIDPNDPQTLDILVKLGLTGEDALIYIATPTPFHVPYARWALRTGSWVAVEKPLTTDPSHAACFLREGNVNLSLVDHQLFKKGMLRAIAQVTGEEMLAAESFEFQLLETGSVGIREIENAIHDTGYHGFACILALLESSMCITGDVVEINIRDVYTATYDRDPIGLRPKEFTAARIEGFISFAGITVPFLIRVAKGVGHGSKKLVIRGKSNRIQRIVTLDESGWHAHCRLLRRLIMDDSPDLGIDEAGVLRTIEACRDASDRARYKGYYEFGSIPSFLLAFTYAPMQARSARRRTSTIALIPFSLSSPINSWGFLPPYPIV